jgi:protein SCO1/2
MSDTTTAPPATPPSPPGPDRDARLWLTVALVGVAAALVLAAGAVAVLVGSGGDGDTADDGGWHGVLQDPTPRPEFTLTDTEGRPFDFAAETQGRLTLLFFGYTHCPDICPGHMSILTGALEMPGVPQPQVVFVTTDPARDTPERLRDWLDNFDDDYIGLTGTVEEVAAAEAAAFVGGSSRLDDEGRPVAVEPDPASDYQVGHAAQILAYTPDDQAHVVYPFGVRRQDWAADLPRLLEEFPAGSATGDAQEGDS